MQPLQYMRDKTVIVTGASSGIGRATALAFAGCGANVVIAARRARILADVANECRAAGGVGFAVATDVTDPEQVDALARAAIDRFGCFDIWVNNAAVLAMGRFEDVPPEAFRRVVETNFLGRVYAVRAALRHFRTRGRGTIIEVNSVLGILAQPYASAYIASKFAGRGFNQSVRAELFDSPHIHICSVLPAPVDTPIYHRAANFTGHEIRPMWPLYDPQVVADAVVRQAVHPRRQVIAGSFGRLLVILHALSPTLTAHLARLAVDLVQIGAARAPDSYGNLLRPESGRGAVTGGWRERYRKALPRTSLAILGLALPVLGTAAWLVAQRLRSPRKLGFQTR